MELCQGKLQVLSLWNLTLLHFEAKHKEHSAPWPQHSWSVRQIPPEPDGNGGALGIPCARVSPCPRSWEQLPLLPAALYPSGYRLSLQSWEAWLSDRQLPPVPVPALALGNQNSLVPPSQSWSFVASWLWLAGKPCRHRNDL